MPNRFPKVFEIVERMGKSLDAHHHNTKFSNFLADISWYPGYAEPGYQANALGVYVAYWSNINGENLPERLSNVLEKLGAKTESTGEWTPCSECDLLVRTESNGCNWRKHYWLNKGGEVICYQCLAKKPAEYIDFLKHHNKTAALAFDLDLSLYGWKSGAEVTDNVLFQEKLLESAEEAGNWVIIQDTFEFSTFRKVRIWTKPKYKKVVVITQFTMEVDSEVDASNLKVEFSSTGLDNLFLYDGKEDAELYRQNIEILTMDSGDYTL